MNNVEEHRDYLVKLNFSEKDIAEIIRDDDEDAMYEMSRFMRFCWRGVIDKDIEPGWLKRTVEFRSEDEIDRSEAVLEFYDESPEVYDSLTNSLSKILESGVDENDLALVIKEAQKNTLAELLQMIDGSLGLGDFGMFESKFENDENTALRSFSDMESFFLNYDPMLLK